jgi:hypothetical protein
MNIAWNCQSILACRHSPKSSPENPANGMTEGIERIRKWQNEARTHGGFLSHNTIPKAFGTLAY